MINAALELADARWEVVPCWWAGPRAKSPITKHGHLEATTDPDQIKLWWTKWPNAMIGSPVPESLLVIDVDPRNGGSLTALESLTGPLPATLTAWSGRNDGGQHLYFQRPAGPMASTRLPKGIDLKVNGYCIVPPSTHPATGLPYRWEHHPVAAPTPKLRELLRPQPQPVHTFGDTKNGSRLIRAVAEAQERSRHNVLVWASFRAQDDGILDQISEELVAAAVAAGGETDSSARRVIASVRRAAS